MAGLRAAQGQPGVTSQISHARRAQAWGGPNPPTESDAGYWPGYILPVTIRPGRRQPRMRGRLCMSLEPWTTGLATIRLKSALIKVEAPAESEALSAPRPNDVIGWMIGVKAAPGSERFGSVAAPRALTPPRLWQD